MDNLTKDLTYTEFYMRENELVHAPVETEMSFYDCVKRGDMEAMKRASSSIPAARRRQTSLR